MTIVKVLRSLVTVCVAIYAPAALAQTFVSECAKAIKFDSSEIQTNFASKLAVLDSIEQSNFAQVRDSGQLGIVVEGLPINASFEQFSVKRDELRKLFSLNQSLKYSQSNSWQAVSPESVTGYIECLKLTSKESMLVAVEAVNKTAVQLHVIKREFAGQRNTDTLQALVLGGRLVNPQPITMKGGADEPLLFERDPGKDFTVALSLRNKDGTSIASKNISIARYVKIVPGTPKIEVLTSETSICRASKNEGNSDRTVAIAALSGSRLDSEGAKFFFNTADPSCMVGSATPKWVVKNDKRIEMTVTCASTKAECTSTANSNFTVPQITDTYQEEK